MFSRINFLNGFNPKMSFLEKWVNFGEYAKRMGFFWVNVWTPIVVLCILCTVHHFWKLCKRLSWKTPHFKKISDTASRVQLLLSCQWRDNANNDVDAKLCQQGLYKRRWSPLKTLESTKDAGVHSSRIKAYCCYTGTCFWRLKWLARDGEGIGGRVARRPLFNTHNQIWSVVEEEGMGKRVAREAINGLATMKLYSYSCTVSHIILCSTVLPDSKLKWCMGRRRERGGSEGK